MPIPESKQELARARLRHLWETGTTKDKTQMARKLGFRGSDATARDSASRLISSSETRRRAFTRQSQLDYLAGRHYRKFGTQVVEEAGKYEKGDVTEFFKPYVLAGQRAWTGLSPPLAYRTRYRIAAYIMGVYGDSGRGYWETRAHAIWTRGTADNFPRLAAMLQERVELLYEQPEAEYETYGVAFSEEGAIALAERASRAKRVVLVPPPGEYGVDIYSSTVRGGDGFRDLAI